MTRLIGALLLVWAPLNFAVEALTVLPTIVYRGWLPGVELAGHAVVAAIGAAGGLALWNGGHHAVRMSTIAIIATVARIIQSVYWSTLPNATVPGSELLIAGIALLAGATSLALVHRTSHVST